MQAADFIRLAIQQLAGFRGAGRNRDYDASGTELAQRRHGGPHRRAGGEPVVDDDHFAPAHVERRALATERALATRELDELELHESLDLLGREPQRLQHVLVHHACSAGGERAHGELLVPGHAELAYDEDVERRAQRPRYLGRYRNSAARQREHDHIVATGVTPQRIRELSPGVPPIFETRC